MKITFHFFDKFKDFSKKIKKSQDILQKLKKFCPNTQVFANSELEIVAEKRPKIEPDIVVHGFSVLPPSQENGAQNPGKSIT